MKLARLALALAALLAAWAGALPAPLAAAALAVTFLLTPGLVLAPALFRDSPEAVFAAAIALSPFLSGAPVAALVAVGVPLAAAARGLALLLAVLVVVVPAPRAAAPFDARSRVAWIAAGAWLAFVVAHLLRDPALPSGSDGWYHAAITLQVLDRGLPLEDPYFAGVRLLYYWGAHVWAACWLALAPRLSPYTPLVAYDLGSAVAVVLAVSALARRLGAGPGRVGLAAAVLTFGYSPFCWLFPVARACSGVAPGWPKFVAMVTHGTGPLMWVLAWGQLHSSMVFFADKFLVLTQFSLAYALVALAVLALLEPAGEPRPRAALAFGVLLAATLFLHAISGAALVACAAVACVLRVPAALRGEPRARARLAALALATAAAVLLLSPYLVAITLGGRGHAAPGVTLRGLVTLALGGACYVVPGLAWLGTRAGRTQDAQALAAAAGTLLVLAVCTKLPGANQSKFFNLAFLVLAAPAAMGWAAWLARVTRRARALAIAALVLAVLPTQVLVEKAIADEPGQPGGEPYAPPVRAAMRWARANTPADAAFCDLSGARDVLTVAGRSVLWGGYAGERDYGYPPGELQARRELVGALCRGREPGAAGSKLLAGLHREVIVVRREGAPDSLGDLGAIAAHPERFERLWGNERVSFWRVRVP